MVNQNPEQKARDNIDAMLASAGWQVQDKDSINFNKGPGIAVREYQTSSGPADYVLFVNREPCGVIEAKREEEGARLTVHEQQSKEYADSKLKWINNDKPLPFIFESTGEITCFTDQRDPKPRSRPVFHFFKPETLIEWLTQEESLRQRIQGLPSLLTDGLRRCQKNAINNLDISLKASRPRALVQMATGSGKTFTAITSVYRLLKHADAKRVLFLVDTKNLGEQAEQEFRVFQPNDDNRKFVELYNIQRLQSSYIAADSQVCISTIQRMYSILQGKELDQAAEELNPNEINQTGKPKEVQYNSKVPVEFFDFIIVDECHRSIYNLWAQVLDYFDAFQIGLTATPDKRTFGYFNENVVSEYTHEDAVADGVNVSYIPYIIETDITKNGAVIKSGEFVDKRHKLTRKKRWTQLDTDEIYNASKLDRDVVNPSQIRNVIREFKKVVNTKLFPERTEVPKTLIFAKNDSHADDIIRIVREEFDEGNEFCKKVTYRSEENPKSILTCFRNEYNPRIAVTVDMIATGTDVKPLECLLFMRDVRSKNYFEQMKGRGTRTYDYDSLKLVTPSTLFAKTHFVLVDAVGVLATCKTDSRSLELKPSVSLKDLLYSVMMGADDEDTITTLAGRLNRLSKQLSEAKLDKIQELAGDKPLNAVVHELLDSVNPDTVEQKAREDNKIPEDIEPTQEQLDSARKELVSQASTVFTGELNEYIIEARRELDQIIDTVNLDKITMSDWRHDAADNAATLIADFKTYIEEHKDEIIALSIFYSQPYRRRELTYEMLKQLLETIKDHKPAFAPANLWQAYGRIEKVSDTTPKNELTALVSLIRRLLDIDSELTDFEKIVNRNFKDWIFGKHAAGHKFTAEQITWLQMIRDHIAASFHINRGDLEYAPFDAKGGIGKMYQLFGDQMDDVINELNEALVA